MRNLSNFPLEYFPSSQWKSIHNSKTFMYCFLFLFFLHQSFYCTSIQRLEYFFQARGCVNFQKNIPKIKFNNSKIHYSWKCSDQKIDDYEEDVQSKKERLIWSKSLDVKCNFQLSLARHLKMAGIIARITRSNRERLEKKQAEVNINKSIYDIRPFDDRFVPQKHNHYTVCREYYAETFEAMEFYDFVTKRLQELQKEEESSRAFTWCTFIFEAILMVLSIVTVPSLMVFLYLTWPVQIDK